MELELTVNIDLYRINWSRCGGNSTSGIILQPGTTFERPASGQAGQIRFNTTTGEMEFWSSTSSTPQWRSIKDGPLMAFALQYLVVGGGGAGTGQMSGGGGAGGLCRHRYWICLWHIHGHSWCRWRCNNNKRRH